MIALVDIAAGPAVLGYAGRDVRYAAVEALAAG
jgi:hypothetical protein